MLLIEATRPLLNPAGIYTEFPHCSWEMNLQAEDKHTYSPGDNTTEMFSKKAKMILINLPLTHILHTQWSPLIHGFPFGGFSHRGREAGDPPSDSIIRSTEASHCVTTPVPSTSFTPSRGILSFPHPHKKGEGRLRGSVG